MRRSIEIMALFSALRSKVAIQHFRQISGKGKMIYFFQSGQDVVVKKMHHLQFITGGWLEGTKEWGLLWRKTRPSPAEQNLKCTSGSRMDSSFFYNVSFFSQFQVSHWKNDDCLEVQGTINHSDGFSDATVCLY